MPRMKTTNLLAIQRVLRRMTPRRRVLEKAGVVFLDPGEHREGGVGVRSSRWSHRGIVEVELCCRVRGKYPHRLH